MSSSNSEIYKWKRWSRTPSSLSKKVEAASDQATAITFGRSPSQKYPIRDGYNDAMETIAALQDNNEAQNEAQDLLNQWMVEQLKIDDSDLRFDDEDDDLLMRRNDDVRNAEKSDLETILDIDFGESNFLDPYNGIKSEDVYNEIDSRNDSETVQGILEGMLNQEFVDNSFKQNLGLQKKHKDPKMTMEARQNQVKANRLKRQQEREEKLRTLKAKKDAQFQAKQMVLKEEKEKVIKSKKEEKLIQQEMTRIRKQMLEQRRLEEESKLEQKRLEEEAKMKERQREDRQEAVREEAIQQLKKEEEENRRRMEEEKRELLRNVHNLKVEKRKEELKILKQHFSAWYKLTLNNRLKIGKARAVADWRCMLRAWNAWRAYVHAARAEREMKETEHHIKENHRKRISAEKHRRCHLLRKHFVAWHSWTQAELQSRELFKDKNMTRNKMALFLEAAASGKLWSNREQEHGIQEDTRHKGVFGSTDSNNKHIEDIFANAGKKNMTSVASTARSEISEIRSNASGDTRKKRTVEKPRHAWQVTRKHTKLTKNEIASLQEDEGLSNCNNSSGKKDMSLPRSKQNISYTVNNFEHRYAAQQKILLEQQNQLKEQHRMIEELQAKHRQNALQQELLDVQVVCERKLEPNTSHEPPLDLQIPITERSQTASTARSESTATIATSASSSSRSNAPLLKGMEERAMQRAKRKAEIDDRRRKREEEQSAKRREEEDRRKAEEEAEKRARIEKRREEKRLAQQKELEKQARLNQIAENNTLASEHYRLTLIRNKGFKPWTRLMQMSNKNHEIAVNHHSDQILRNCLMSWHHHTQTVLQDKRACADELYGIILEKRYFNSWKRYGHYQSIQLQKARRHYRQTLVMKFFNAWSDHTLQEKLAMIDKETLARQHDHIRGLKTVFNAWKRFPKLLKTEREREKRVLEMRKKVASLLPDFGS
ncbi:coiled-coil domain-containing protein 191-like isoform X2 [Anneissia japonica]|uniref:coiled-coil domain-containing protein 191-like isoform X2 n=1 Tax=Anneissia japonica TaxID=1529436 RepID=UPI001425977B|nr:coiled-coil domain-containing protein 191-like isoform X2 [Anneissia japonica]